MTFMSDPRGDQRRRLPPPLRELPPLLRALPPLERALLLRLAWPRELASRCDEPLE